MPDQSTLERLKATLDAGGTFRWLSGPWRAARKQLLGHATSTRVKFKTLMSLLAKAARFAGARQQFNDNATYCELLGEHAKGLETPLPSLEDVRQWYRQVRQTYGVGFGPKVSLGDAIIHLPDQLARHIRSLAERGIDSQLDRMLGELSVLKTIFVPGAELQNGKTMLAGESGLIDRLLDTLDEALRDCEPLIADATLTVAELASRIEALVALKQDITRWAMSDVDHRLFQGQLGLQIGVGVDNAAVLAKAQHTLDVAACLTHELATPFVSRRVYDQPEAGVFAELRAMAAQLRAVTEGQLEAYAAFETLVALDFAAWCHHCGDAIKALMERNARALSFPQALNEWLYYVQIRDQLGAMGFNRLANAVERGDIHVDQVEDAYYAGVYDVLAREILREEPELSRFSGYTQEALRCQFKDYDDRLKKLQCERIAWQVDQNKMPLGTSRGRVRDYTEYTLLQHECNKKTRHISLRQLLRHASRALVALKPCFMMGPMSVAQYLVPGQMDFDMVVMDEASQIKPEDALGAVARGAQLIVVRVYRTKG